MVKVEDAWWRWHRTSYCVEHYVTIEVVLVKDGPVKVIWVENVEVFKPSGLLFKILSKSFAYCGVFNVLGERNFTTFIFQRLSTLAKWNVERWDKWCVRMRLIVIKWYLKVELDCSYTPICMIMCQRQKGMFVWLTVTENFSCWDLLKHKIPHRWNTNARWWSLTGMTATKSQRWKLFIMSLFNLQPKWILEA